MHKILVATVRGDFQKEFWSPVVEKKLQEYGFELEILMREKLSLEELPSDPAVEAVVTTWGSPRFTAAAFEKFPSLKFLGHCAGSVAGVVAPDFYAKGGRVFSANYVMATAVAEWSLLMTLLHSRNFFKSSAVRQGELMDWNEKFSMGNLRESVIGIWGFGDITRHLLKMLKPLNIGRILVSSKHASAEEIEACGAEKVPFEDLFKYADMIHCLVGVTPDTYHGIGAKELAALKDGSAIINGAKNLDNAKLFMDWLISDECQTIMATAEGSVLRGVRTDLFVPTDYMPAFDTLNLKQENSEYTSSNKQTILDHWNQLWNK